MNRYCVNCKREHGPLYICESYDDKTKIAIRNAVARMMYSLRDPQWVKSELDRGIPLEVIEMMKHFEPTDYGDK